VTRWGLILLLVYLGLGLSSLERRRMLGYAVSLTTLVLVYVSFNNGAL
jgi:hypothetical protein